MASTEALKKIYERINPELSFCMFAPNLDKDKWEKVLNSMAPSEEPLSVLCIGEANSKGVLSTFFSAGKFLFTDENLYLKKLEGIKYSDIESISYQEEMKKAMFGFGKEKPEGHIIVKLENDDSIDLKGNYATEPIANFLNEAVNELKKNPPERLPEVDSSQADALAEVIKNYHLRWEWYNCGWTFKPHIKHEDINSAIIHEELNERYSTCSACYAGLSKKIYFFNETLVSENHVAIRYDDIDSVTYDEKTVYGGNYEKKIDRFVIFYGKGEQLLVLKTESENGEKIAKSLKAIIGSAKSRTQEGKKKTNEKMEKWILENKNEYIKFQNEEDKKLFFDLLDKWNEIFLKDWQVDKIEEDKNLASYKIDKSYLEFNVDFDIINSETDDDDKNLSKLNFKYFPDIESNPDKYLSFYSIESSASFVLSINAKAFSQDFKTDSTLGCSYDRFFIDFEDVFKEILQKPKIYENMVNCIETLEEKIIMEKQRQEKEASELKQKQEQEEMERKRKQELDKIEKIQKTRNEIADW